jgi:hypothetical protein
MQPEMTGPCAMLSTIEMRVAELKIGAQSETAFNRNGTMRGTMIIMVPSMTNLIDNVP